jgi:diamine N-acetyltransferase
VSVPDVTLRDVTAETMRAVCDLEVRPAQREFVAPNVMSIAQAYFEPRAWFRAVYADETPVGFVMVHEDPDVPRCFLWRFMIAADHQSKGYGRRALDLVVERLRARNLYEQLLSSYVPGDDGPGAFYLAYGFVETGETTHGEVVIRLPLS